MAPRYTRKRLGYLPQQTNIQKDFPASVYEVVLSGCLNRRGLKPFTAKQIKNKQFNIWNVLASATLKTFFQCTFRWSTATSFTGTRALCATDKLLLLDEPVTGLDPLVTEELYQLIEQLNRDLGVTIIMVSHDISSATQYADKILHISQSLLFYGDTESYINTELGKRFLKCS